MYDNLARNNYSTPISNKYKNTVADKIKVTFYARVSTEHEAQVNALENQIQWYNSILKDHPNWEKVGVYVDNGITGTKASKREGFMQMIEDAATGKFDLICTREVSRFARNTVDSLNYTRQLAKMGVEVFFYNDNIWSLEHDGELRLTIMSAMGQEESRHISDRVLAGQAISREKKILYGNGNILGYNLIKGSKSSENTYIIDEQGAETVRMIYDLYLEGLGVKAIASKMQELGRNSALSGCKWDATKVLRILDNKTYAGYLAYKKSYTTNFLEHSRVAIRDRSKHEYIKADFPAIIPEEKWNRVQSLKSKKVTYFQDKKIGKTTSKDRWTKVLVCECGRTYKKYLWRTNRSGEICYGYQCWNQVNNRKRSFREKHGLDTEGYCDVPSICEWKLDFMMKSILHRLWDNPRDTVTILLDEISENYVVDNPVSNFETDKLKREQERLNIRLNTLLDMRLDNQISKESYDIKYQELNARLADISEKLKSEITINKVESCEDVSESIANITEILNATCDLQQKQIADDLVEALITRIVPKEDGTFEWYFKTERDDELITFNADEYILYDEFNLEYDDAKVYRKSFGNYLRTNQWKDLQVKVFIKN